ncbi:hypothetical protein [Aquimarina mytili]|uniref:Uncharacterized protein n=1 Tax=Aquimarina mytili TaxID=874423 RepID=A0A936ZVL8_9FLAO|nr:hypothetical protein [Aquimarina mytili]MBL0682815.1 hypothetical protein [Aquimarina mytili]
MKKIVLISIALLSYSVYSQEEKKEYKKDEKQVYICNSMKSERYHYKKDCRAIQKCQDTIVKILLKKARNIYGRTVCGFETHVESSSRSKN